ncbi:hypothetical protein FIBSPDRAFT_323369 [Athelia psychrophila]|uniref:Uncharacterized protein n=1 Tax=Athelia psychrophila TaxID=1759441 RepID=A0A167WQ90_9AGAM|nr:hypothetical protein FIBSPDRAFT_323369 [Fibularhizoctonia sp. CBS 109695]
MVREFPSTFCEHTGVVKCLGGEMGWREQVEAPPARQRVHAQLSAGLFCPRRRPNVEGYPPHVLRTREGGAVPGWGDGLVGAGGGGRQRDSARTRNIRWPVLPAAASRRRGRCPARLENVRGRRSSWMGRWDGGSRRGGRQRDNARARNVRWPVLAVAASTR